MYQDGNLKARKPKPCWFDLELQKNGNNMETLITGMDDTKIYRDSQRIFRDLMYRNVNLATYGVFFTNQRFMNIIYQNAYDRYCKYNALYNALLCYNEFLSKDSSNNATIDYIVSLMAFYQKLSFAYSFICEALNAVKTTGNPSYLFSLSDKLAPYQTELRNE